MLFRCSTYRLALKTMIIIRLFLEASGRNGPSEGFCMEVRLIICRFPRRPPSNIFSVDPPPVLPSPSARSAESFCREAEQHCSFSLQKGAAGAAERVDPLGPRPSARADLRQHKHSIRLNGNQLFFVCSKSQHVELIPQLERECGRGSRCLFTITEVEK